MKGKKITVAVVIIFIVIMLITGFIFFFQQRQAKEELPLVKLSEDSTSSITTVQGRATGASITSSKIDQEPEISDMTDEVLEVAQEQPIVTYTPILDEEGEISDAPDETPGVNVTPPIPIAQGQPTITYTPSSDQEIERFGVTGSVIEIHIDQNFLKVTGNNQKIYTVVVLSSTEIIKSGSKIILSEVQIKDQISAITSENIKENLNFEAESIYIIENIPLLLGL